MHARGVPFAYYRRLSRYHKAIYRRSDEYGSVELEDARALAPIAAALGDVLAADDRVEVERLTQRLVAGICRQMGVPIAAVRVMAVRPRSASAELYGLYVRSEDERPVIYVWMRTAAREKPVAHRTYLRTVFHEVCHHLDYDLLDLEESFHTRGFFQRESSLMRQILVRRAGSVAQPERPAPIKREPAPKAEPPRQLDLPLQ